VCDMSPPDVIVIGGGVIGCSVARTLVRLGARVSVVERSRPGRGATWAAGGMLSPVAEATRPGPFLELALRSFAAFPAFAAALREESGIDPELRTDGKLRVALNEPEAARLAETHAWHATEHLDVRWLNGAEARELEPQLAESVVAALDIRPDHQVNNRALANALSISVQRSGVRFVPGVTATRILAEAGGVIGVELADGELLRADAVVVAAGAWAAHIDGLPQPLPIRPVFGEIVALQPAWQLRRVVASESCYLIPRNSGELLVGATMAEAGFRDAPTAAGVLQLLNEAVRVLPELGDATLLEAWCGLRPGTPDGLPILGPDPDLSGLHYATGHFRNGILLAPVTAELVAALVAGREADIDPLPFSISRFRRSAS
jgi:glycine oxidase